MNYPNPIKSIPVISASCKYTGSIMPFGHTWWVAILSAAFCLLCVPATVLAQTQLGADIDGEAAEDSAYKVSLCADGNRLAIGAGGNDGNGTGSGHVRVYEWSGMAWTQLGADIDGEAAANYSGRSVSLSSDGNRLAVSAPWNGSYSGHSRVYHWSGSTWVQLGTDIDGEAADDFSGESLSLSSDGNRLAIGAGGNDGNGDRSGHVRVFDLSMFNVFKINPGLNDAWYDDQTDGQGFFITVFPDLGYVSLAWFTYDTELPPIDAVANLGDAGHRWLTAIWPNHRQQGDDEYYDDIRWYF